MLARLPIPVPPARHEFLASYLHRLGNLHGLDPAGLHEQINTGGTPVAALAALTGRAPERLRAALPELREEDAACQLFRHEPQPGCPRCDARHPGGPVLRLLPHNRYACLRHGLWIGPPDIPAPPTPLTALPEVIRAQRRHLRLLHRCGPAATYDAVLTAFLICGHIWTDPPKPETANVRHTWTRRCAVLIEKYDDFSASRVFAAAYPEAVGLAGLLAHQRWRQFAHGEPQQRQQFLAEIGRRLDGPAYTPGQTSDAIAHWMSWDAPRPPITPPKRNTRASTRSPAFATGKANQARHDRSRYWFSRQHDGGNVILHHRHIRPVLIRPWSPSRERIEGAIWVSAGLDPPPKTKLVECAT